MFILFVKQIRVRDEELGGFWLCAYLFCLQPVGFSDIYLLMKAEIFISVYLKGSFQIIDTQEFEKYFLISINKLFHYFKRLCGGRPE